LIQGGVSISRCRSEKIRCTGEGTLTSKPYRRKGGLDIGLSGTVGGTVGYDLFRERVGRELIVGGGEN